MECQNESLDAISWLLNDLNLHLATNQYNEHCMPTNVNVNVNLSPDV